MSLLHIEGWELYGTGSDSQDNLSDGIYADVRTGGVASSGAVTSDNPRTGTRAFRCSNDNADTTRTPRLAFAGPKGVVGMGAAIRVNSLPATESFGDNGHYFSLTNAAGTELLSLRITPNGAIAVGDISDGRTTANNVITAGLYHHVEIRVMCEFTSGEIEIRVDGTSVGSWDDLTIEDDCSSVRLFVYRNTTLPSEDLIRDFDDWFVWDDEGYTNNAFLGDRRVHTLFPNGDEPGNEWNSSPGSVEHEQINETTPDDDSSYIEAGTDSGELISEFDLEDLPGTVTEIDGLQIVTRSKKTDSAPASIKATMISNNVESEGTSETQTTDYAYYTNIVEQDPDADSDWTPSTFNSALLRLTRVE